MSSIDPVTNSSYPRTLHMHRRRSFTSITAREAWLLSQAVFYTVATRLALWTVPSAHLLRFVRRRVDRIPADGGAGEPTGHTVAWSVRAASRRIPRASCLTQALAVQLLLARYGYSSKLQIGVARKDGHFVAHAWVEFGGRIVTGDDGHGQFQPLPDLSSVLDVLD
jgi:hypothetical protein